MNNVYKSIMDGLDEAIEDTKNNKLPRNIVTKDDLSDIEFDTIMDRELEQGKALDDVTYDFEPLELFQPDSNYKVDEEALRKSKERSKEMISKIRKDDKKA